MQEVRDGKTKEAPPHDGPLDAELYERVETLARADRRRRCPLTGEAAIALRRWRERIWPSHSFPIPARVDAPATALRARLSARRLMEAKARSMPRSRGNPARDLCPTQIGNVSN
jgi:hypothetical protein